jgi:hypothetical protein
MPPPTEVRIGVNRGINLAVECGALTNSMIPSSYNKMQVNNNLI